MRTRARFVSIGVLCSFGIALAADPETTIRASGRGLPYLSLGDGRKVVTRYSDSSFRAAQARPLSLASADFDEDGMPDLASGYGSGAGGFVTLHRGNVEALWPRGNSAAPPFLPDARVVALPEAPDFLGAGDFDADGHWDLVAASLGSRSLYLLRGDGHGGFLAPERIALPGAVTAFTTGEINRVDGLTDIAIGVTAADGAQVLMFESPRGALREKPETFPAPGAVTALAMMPLDDDRFNDLAVACGNQLLAIHGRDRKLSYPKPVRESVPAAEVVRQTLPFTVRALASGHFTSATLLDLAALGDDGHLHFLERADAGYQAARAALPVTLPARDGRPGPVRRGNGNVQSLPLRPESKELVLRDDVILPGPYDPSVRLVAAHSSLTGGDDCIVTGGRSGDLQVVSRHSRSVRSMRPAAALETVAGAAAAVLPLRLAPSALHGLVVLQNGQPEPSVVTVQTTAMFTVTNTQDGGGSGGSLQSTAIPGSLRTAISNAYNASGASLITFEIPTTDPNYNAATGTFTIQPIPNTNCGPSDGVPCDGLPPLPAGVTLDGYTQMGASANTVTSGDNAVLKIAINGASAGLGPTGLWLTNGDDTVRGVIVTGFNAVTLGGQPTGGAGVTVESGGNIIEGVFVGVDSTGTTAQANYGGVVTILGANTVGGTTPQARNLLSGNNYGNFSSAGESAPNTYFFQGNFVGTDRTGTHPVGGGGFLEGGQAMVIGGTTAGAGNVISGNIDAGISLNQGQGNSFTPDNNLIQGNLIGTDVTGSAALGNQGGVSVGSGNGNLLGGTSPAARNVVAANSGDAVAIIGIVGQTTVQGNYIGVDASGENAMGNGGMGIDQSDLNPSSTSVTGTLIGGDVRGAGNVISNGTAFGLELGGSSPVTVLGNLIGTDATGVNPMPNASTGIAILQGGSGNAIGGTDAPEANVIAFNGGPGVLINPAANNPGTNNPGANTVIGNRIFSNQGVGVSIQSGTGNVVSQNSIYSNLTPGIELNTGSNQYNSNCQSNMSGPNNLQNTPVLTPLAGGATLVSATATDENNNTSQFSNCAPMGNTGNTLNINGSLNSLPNATYTLEFFRNSACDASGYGQGQTFLNRITVTTNGQCTASFGDNVNIATADLGVTLTYNSSVTYPYRNPGQTFIYEALVTNNSASGGASAASAANATLTDTLPAGVSFVSATPTQGTCTNNSGLVTCSLGTLASGASATIDIAVTVTAVGSISNTVNVSSSTPDPNNANNSASESISSSYAFPVIDHFSPASALAGVGALPLTIYGGPFYSGVTTVTANNNNLTYTLTGNQICGSGTCQGLAITLPATYTASAGAVTFTVSNPTPGGGSDSATFTIYAPAGTVTQLQLAGIPNPSLAGPTYNLTVTAIDSCGNVVPGYRGTIKLVDSLGIVTFNGGYTYTYTFVAGDNGVHTFTTLFDSDSFGYVDGITATDQGTPSIMGTLNTLVNPVLGSPSQLVSSGTPVNVPIGFPFQPLLVNVQDSNGNSVPGVTVTFTAPSTGPGGTFSNNQNTINVVSDGNGNAQAVLTANATPGTFAVSVAAAGTSPVQYNLTSTTNVPAYLSIISGYPASGPVNTQNLGALVVQVTDTHHDPVSGIAVTFSAPSTGASTNLTNAVVLTGNEGGGGQAVLTPIGVANAIAGPYMVTATVGTMSITASFTNTSPANPVAQIFTTGGGQSTPARAAFPAALFVLPQDANGDCLARVPITFTAPASGPSATFSASTVTSDPVTCGAQVTATANGVAGGPYNVTATAGGVSTTFSLTNLPGVTTLTATGGTPQATEPGTAFPNPLQVSLVDQNGNPLACRITFLDPTTGATANLSAASTVANSAGAAQVTAAANGTAGSYSVTALFGSAQAVFSLANVTPGGIAATGGTPQTASPGKAFATPLRATVTDGSGNPIVGILVSFAAPASGAGAILSASSALTNAAGIATVTATANNLTGSYPVTATVGGYSAQFSLTNSAFSPCDVNQDGATTAADAQQTINEALGKLSPMNDLDGDGIVNVVDTQLVIDAVMGNACLAR